MHKQDERKREREREARTCCKRVRGGCKKVDEVELVSVEVLVFLCLLLRLLLEEQAGLRSVMRTIVLVRSNKTSTELWASAWIVLRRAAKCSRQSKAARA
jgi:hypothetical protein